MKSWKMRVLMMLTMLAMLVVIAVPALASHDWEAYCVDWDDEGCDEYILCREVADDKWECIGPFDVDDDWGWDDHDDDGDKDDDGVPDWLD